MNIDYEKLKDLLLELSKCGTTSYSASDEYNIFEVLGVGDKEVIVCRFIGDLLDCKGKHGLGSEPLRLFIKDVLHDEDFGDNLDESNIVLEDSTDNGRRVDIVIYLNSKIYPIEVKIWAGDRDEQLADYYKYYFPDRQDAKIYYLTPNGHSPSEKSKVNLNDGQIVCISFTEEIKGWLNAVCDIKSASENIKSVIRNFMEVIDKMGQDSEELKTIVEKLGLDFDKRAYDRKVIEGASYLLKHRDKIWVEIRKNYIYNNTVQGNIYELEPCGEEDKDMPYALFCVKKNNEIVAWICVETNLYIVARKKDENGKCDTGWTQYTSDEKYQWQYITNNDRRLIPLKTPTELKGDLKIDLEDLLKGVVD